MLTILIILFTIVFVILSLKRLDLSLLLLIALLPTYLLRFSFFNLPTNILELMVTIIFLIWLIQSFLPNIKNWKKQKRTPYPFSKEIIALIIISYIALWIGNFDFHTLSIWKAYFFEPIIIFILIINTFQKKNDWQKILKALLVSIFLISLPALYQEITGNYILNPFWANSAHRRVTSWFPYPNALGLYLAPLTILLFSWLFYLKKTYLKIITIIIIILSILSIYFAHSEGALIALLASLVYFGLMINKKARVITIIATLLLSLLFLLYPPTENYLVTKLTLQDLSGEIRKQQWKETWMMLKDKRLLTGAGLNNYQTVTKPYHQEGIFFNKDHLKNFDSRLYGSAELRAKYWQPTELYLYPHNIFLNFWSELGLLGLLIFVWIFIKYFIATLKLSGIVSKRERPILIGLSASSVVIIIHGLVDVPYFKNDLSMLFWILISLLGLFIINNKQNGNTTPKDNRL